MDKETVREAILQLGADVCGFAAAERFADAPEGFRPTDIFPACKTVIVYGAALPKGTLDAPPAYLYSYFNRLSVDLVDRIGFLAASYIERSCGLTATPLPCDGPVESYDAETRTKRGILSMKHAAVRAGIGTLGKNTLLLSAAFGNRLTVGALLTDAAFPSDAPAESVCIEGCRLCLDSCPAHAIAGGHVTQKPCRENAYAQDALGYDCVLCNRCRTVCPMRYGELAR